MHAVLCMPSVGFSMGFSMHSLGEALPIDADHNPAAQQQRVIQLVLAHVLVLQGSSMESLAFTHAVRLSSATVGYWASLLMWILLV